MPQFYGSHLGTVTAAEIDPTMMHNLLVATKAEGAAAGSASAPIVPGAPPWLSVKNLAIGGGITFATILAYMLLVPPKKKAAAAPMAGLGRFFGFGRRRRRRR